MIKGTTVFTFLANVSLIFLHAFLSWKEAGIDSHMKDIKSVMHHDRVKLRLVIES